MVSWNIHILNGLFFLFYPFIDDSLDIKEQDDDGMYAEEKEEEIEMLEGFEEVEEAGEYMYRTAILVFVSSVIPFFEKKILNISVHCNQNISHTCNMLFPLSILVNVNIPCTKNSCARNGGGGGHA